MNIVDWITNIDWTVVAAVASAVAAWNSWKVARDVSQKETLRFQMNTLMGFRSTKKLRYYEAYRDIPAAFHGHSEVLGLFWRCHPDAEDKELKDSLYKAMCEVTRRNCRYK